jgi:hypothetical protein
MMNWAIFGMTVFATLFAAWIFAVIRRKPAWPSIVGGAAFVIVAGLNGAAPVRGFVDPDYVGYSFGLLSAAGGVEVTLISGCVFLVAAIGAFAAIGKGRPALAFTLAAAAAMLAIIGVPWAASAITDPAGNAIQFGEYLTIPGVAATVLLLTLTVAPFVIVFVASATRFLKGPHAS